MASAAPRTATLYRMVMDTHVCPYGLLAKHGGETTATFLEGLAGDIRTGAFTVPSRTN